MMLAKKNILKSLLFFGVLFIFSFFIGGKTHAMLLSGTINPSSPEYNELITFTGIYDPSNYSDPFRHLYISIDGIIIKSKTCPNTPGICTLEISRSLSYGHHEFGVLLSREASTYYDFFVSCGDSKCPDEACDDKLNICRTGHLAGDGTCSYEESGLTDCDDGNQGTTPDACLDMKCFGHDPNCNANICINSWFDGFNCVVESFNTNPCNDSNLCTDNDTCANGTCSGSSITCDDGNPCTTDSCNPTSGCQYTDNSNSCDDSDLCTDNDTCANGTCSGSSITCDDGNPCTTNSCNPTSGCQYTDNSNSCDDSDLCTDNDTCTNGTCFGSFITCDDGNPCTTDSCNPTSGCQYTDNSNSCDDGNICTDNDNCTGGYCSSSQFNTISCNDGDLCTDNDTCTNGTCFGSFITCDDGNPCTTGSCDQTSGCIFSPVIEACNSAYEYYDKDVVVVLNDTAKVVLSLLGGITLLFLIIGGLLYISSGSNPETQEKAKKIITYAIIGIIFSLCSFAIIVAIERISIL